DNYVRVCGRAVAVSCATCVRFRIVYNTARVLFIILQNSRPAMLLFSGVCVLFFLSCRQVSNPSQIPVVSRPPQTSYPMPPAKIAGPETGWVVANTQQV